MTRMQAPAPLKRSWHGRRFLWLLSYLVIGVIVYGNALGNGFHYDDQFYIMKNEGIRSLEYLPDIFINKSHYNWDPRVIAHYRPLVTASYAVNYAWGGGLNPIAFHLVNLALHILTALLVAGLLSRLTNQPFVGFLGGMIFLIHPINSEAVNYVTARSSQMYALFYLLSVYAYLRFHPPDGAGSKTVTGDGVGRKFELFAYSSLGISFLAYVLSLLSKEMAITLPLTLFLYEWMLRRPRGWRASLTATLVPLAYLLAVALPYLAMRARLFGEALPSYWARDMVPQIATQTGVLVKSLWLFLVPINLTIDQPVTLYNSLWAWPVLGYTALLAVISYGILRWGVAGSREKRIAAFMGCWFFVSLSMIVIYPLNAILQENRLYLAVVGLIGLTALGGNYLWEWGRRRSVSWGHAMLAGITLLGVFYGGLTIQRNTVWLDDISLWTDAAAKNPTSLVSIDNLGVAYGRASQWELAILQYQRSLLLHPNNPIALFNLGFAYNEQGNRKEAEERFKQAIQMSPQFFMAQYNLGVLYERQGRWAEAIEAFRAVAQSVPRYGRNRQRLADALFAAGRYPDAAKEYEALLSQGIDDPALATKLRERLDGIRRGGR